MMDRTRIIPFLLLTLLFHNAIEAQQSRRKGIPMQVSASAGVLLVPGSISVISGEEYRAGSYQRGPFLDIGLTLGPWNIRSGMEWALQFETGYGSTRSTDFGPKSGIHRIHHHFVPVLIWYRAHNKGNPHFFIRLGAGTAFQNIVLHRLESDDHQRSFWTFAWGIGTGARLSLGRSFAVEFFTQLLSLEGSEMIESEQGYVTTLHDRFMVFPVGVRMVLTL